MAHLQLDVLADEAAQQVRQLGQDVGQVQQARLQGLLARKGKKLAHQVGGAVGVLLDLHDVGERLVARPVAQQQQVGKRSEEHTSELQSLMRISNAVFCLK